MRLQVVVPTAERLDHLFCEFNKGDRSAEGDLFLGCFACACVFARSMCPQLDLSDVEDIAQQSIVDLSQYEGGYQTGDFKRWFFSFVAWRVKRFNDVRRLRARHDSLFTVWTDCRAIDPRSSDVEGIRSRRVFFALKRVEPLVSKCFIARHLDGLSIREIAEKEGHSYVYISNLMKQARPCLQRIIQDPNYPYHVCNHDLEAFISQLPSDVQELVRVARLQDRPFAEVSTRFGLTRPQIKRRLAEVYRFVRSELIKQLD